PTHRIWSWKPGDGPDLELVADRIIEVLDDGEGEEWSLVASNGKEWTLKTRPDLDQPTLARRLADVVGEFDDLGSPATPHLEPVAREHLDRSEHGLLCLLPPVGKEEFWSRTLAQEVFPPKTTFFEPKISTGMVVRYTDEEDV
ncbi:MAG: hypothetical protein ACPG7R_07910, partial [Planctomycetota bacterium]